MGFVERIIFAGFGGQGILAAGKIFAKACMEKGLNASWLPSYGPEMRGGTCNCQVVISDGSILSPVFTRPDSAIIMNQASLIRFLEKLNRARMAIVNSSLVELNDEQLEILKDVSIITVPATDIAQEAGSVQCANMAMLGAYAKYSKTLDIDIIKASIAGQLAKKKELLDINLKVLDKSYQSASYKEGTCHIV